MRMRYLPRVFLCANIEDYLGRQYYLGPDKQGILAAALLLLLAVNIRNAWDLMLAFARQVASKGSDT